MSKPRHPPSYKPPLKAGPGLILYSFSLNPTSLDSSRRIKPLTPLGSLFFLACSVAFSSNSSAIRM